MPKDLIAFFDGGQDSGSGEMLSGFWISETDGTELLNSSVVREKGTTNQAEFRALIGLLDTIRYMVEPGSTITIYGDSQIIINAVNLTNKIKHPNLTHFYEVVVTLLELIKTKNISMTVNWTAREGNKAADYLANLQVINNKRFNPESVREHHKIHDKLAKLKAKDLANAKDKQRREREESN